MKLTAVHIFALALAALSCQVFASEGAMLKDAEKVLRSKNPEQETKKFDATYKDVLPSSMLFELSAAYSSEVPMQAVILKLAQSRSLSEESIRKIKISTLLTSKPPASLLFEGGLLPPNNMTTNEIVHLASIYPNIKVKNFSLVIPNFDRSIGKADRLESDSGSCPLLCIE